MFAKKALLKMFVVKGISLRICSLLYSAQNITYHAITIKLKQINLQTIHIMNSCIHGLIVKGFRYIYSYII